MAISEEYGLIPVSGEVWADMETPISIFRRFCRDRYCFLLESVEKGEKWGRYSFIGKSPFAVIEGYANTAKITDRTGCISRSDKDPASIIREVMAKYKSPVIEGMPNFVGGAVGCFSYDLARQYEKLPQPPVDDLGLPDIHLMLSDEIIAFDHLKQKIHVIVNIHTKKGCNFERLYNSAAERIGRIIEEIRATKWKTVKNHGNANENAQCPDTGTTAFKRPAEASAGSGREKNPDRERFCESVEKIKQHIFDGDIFQAVLSQRLETDFSGEPFEVYRALRAINPSPYMFYMKLGDYSVAGASPEMLVRMEGDLVETCPIAGTRPRGINDREDSILEKELLADPKERAEHMMLVDLGRNDIGRISRFGTVKVENLMHVEKFSHVMHIVTNVSGRLKEGRDALDALISILPAGTVSGAPKIRAMQIIDELEPVKRGYYAGATGYISFDGNMDTCITIRTVIFKGNKAYVQAGAGIVADSVPEKEYEESMRKARAMINAIGDSSPFASL